MSVGLMGIDLRGCKREGRRRKRGGSKLRRGEQSVGAFCCFSLSDCLVFAAIKGESPAGTISQHGKMKFGKELDQEAVPEWREFYVGYRRLKKLMKKQEMRRIKSATSLANQAVLGEGGSGHLGPSSGNLGGSERTPLLTVTMDHGGSGETFEEALGKELEAVDTFFMAKLAECRKDFVATRNEVREGVVPSAEGSPVPGLRRRRRFKEESPEARLLKLYEKVQNLQQYSKLNRTGFRKIVKKYDKTSGEKTLPAFIEKMDKETKFAVKGDAEMAWLLKAINLLYMQVTGDPTRTAKEILAEQKAARGLFEVHLAWKWKPTLLAAVVFTVLLAAPVFSPEHAIPQRCFAMLAFITIMWVTEAVPFFVASLMIPVLSVLLKVMTDESGVPLPADKAVDAVLAKMFNHTTALIIGGFSISTAFSKYGFELILASALVGRLQNYPRVFMLAIMSLCAFLSMWISNVAAPLLCSSIIQPIISDLPRSSRFTKALLLGLAISGNIGGMLTPIASPQNAVALGVFNNYVKKEGQPEAEITFVKWMCVAVPTGCFLILCGWLFLLVAIKPNDIKVLPDVLFESKRFNIFHYLVLAVSFSTIVLWCTQSFTEQIFGNMGFIALFPLVIFLSIGVLTKHDFRERFAWDLVFLIAGGNVLGGAIKSSSLLDIIADPVSDYLRDANMSMWLLMVTACAISLVVCTFISHTVGAIILTPLLVAIGAPLGLTNVQPVIVGATLMYSGAGALPMSSFPNINSLMMEDEQEQKYLTPADFMKFGGTFSVMAFVGTITWGFLWMYIVF
eukprot:comp22443_c0_seq1/m.33709 comp22443_c0_seq1/g.33709  ORF comp22443_c0_seq1/g.33709 comp22443_c0_seq1/m.33709 type:complete len:792 (-) comp22443_c0_seq1:35-2410(-)